MTQRCPRPPAQRAAARTVTAKPAPTAPPPAARVHAVLALAALALAALTLPGCQGRNVYAPAPPPTVTVALPLEQPVQEYFQTTGQTEPVDVVQLRARVGGFLERIEFKDGDMVEEGQLLFVLDRAPFEAQVASAEAALAKAQAQQRLAQQQLNRTQSLAEQQAVTESMLETEQANLASAAADVASAQAALRTAQLDLNYTEIRAPFAGRIGRHQIDVGNLVESGTTLLAPLQSTDPIHAYFNLSESDMLRFMEMRRRGTLQVAEAQPITVELAIGDSTEFAYRGTLDFREFGIDPATGTTQRRAVFPNADGELVPGMFVRVRAAVGDPHPMLIVEEAAVGRDQRGDYLLIVNGEGVVEYRPVQLGLLRDGMRAVESGLRPDDRVIINGLQRARPGAQVEAKLVEMGASLDAAAAPLATPAASPDAQSTPDPAPERTQSSDPAGEAAPEKAPAGDQPQPPPRAAGTPPADQGPPPDSP